MTKPSEWDAPIIIRRSTDTAVIGDAQAAIDFLDHQWPEQRGYLFNLARRRCQANLDDPKAGKAARLAFHAAIAEIGMFPRER
jgi:hypothetical protein